MHILRAVVCTMFGGFGLCTAEEEEGPSKLKRNFDQVAGRDTDADEALKKKFAKSEIPEPDEVAVESSDGSKPAAAASAQRVPPRLKDLEKDLDALKYRQSDGTLSGATSFSVYDVLRQVTSVIIFYCLKFVLQHPNANTKMAGGLKALRYGLSGADGDHKKYLTIVRKDDSEDRTVWSELIQQVHVHHLLLPPTALNRTTLNYLTGAHITSGKRQPQCSPAVKL